MSAGAGQLDLPAHGLLSNAPSALAKRRSLNVASVRQKCRKSLNRLLGRAYAAGGYRGWLNAKLSDPNERAEKGSSPPFEHAELYTAPGNHDKAMRYLDIAYQCHTAWLLELQLNPAYDDLHSDPRYQELIRRIGLPL